MDLFFINLEYTDVLRCDEKNGDCTSVTVVLDEAITGIETAAVYCNFKDVSSQLTIFNFTFLFVHPFRFW